MARTKVGRVLLELERLEDRCVPANYYWRGPADGLWSVAEHFRNDADVEHTVPPGANDVLIFDENNANNSIADIGQVGGLIIQPGYGTITIPDEFMLSILESFEMYGGKILGFGAAAGRSAVVAAGTARWEGGFIENVGFDSGILGMNSSLLITGVETKTLTATSFTIFGSATFIGTADLGFLVMQQDSSLSIFGTFNIEGNPRILGNFPEPQPGGA